MIDQLREAWRTRIHRRGNILLTLKQSGHPVEKSAAYAMWDWDRM